MPSDPYIIQTFERYGEEPDAEAAENGALASTACSMLVAEPDFSAVGSVDEETAAVMASIPKSQAKGTFCGIKCHISTFSEPGSDSEQQKQDYYDSLECSGGYCDSGVSGPRGRGRG